MTPPAGSSQRLRLNGAVTVFPVVRILRAMSKSTRGQARRLKLQPAGADAELTEAALCEDYPRRPLVRRLLLSCQVLANSLVASDH